MPDQDRFSKHATKPAGLRQPDDRDGSNAPEGPGSRASRESYQHLKNHRIQATLAIRHAHLPSLQTAFSQVATKRR